jgi:hypothetical protein
MALRQVRLSDGKSDPLAALFCKVLSTATQKAASEIKYKYIGEIGELDAICLIDDVLFVFECKNSLHPCSVYELRTSFDHLVHAQEQLDRFTKLWVEGGFREILSQKLGWDLGSVAHVVTCIVTGNRMFAGLRLGEHAVRPFYEIGNFVLSGKITILGQEVTLRPTGQLNAAALRDFIAKDALHGKTFAAMERADAVTRLGDTRVIVESYRLNPIKLGKEFGVEIPKEIEDKFNAMGPLMPK